MFWAFMLWEYASWEHAVSDYLCLFHIPCMYNAGSDEDMDSQDKATIKLEWKVCYKRVLPEDQIEFQTMDNRTSAPIK